MKILEGLVIAVVMLFATAKQVDPAGRGPVHASGSS
jgi:hypothetical protein